MIVIDTENVGKAIETVKKLGELSKFMSKKLYKVAVIGGKH
jgi:hypothetical protein